MPTVTSHSSTRRRRVAVPVLAACLTVLVMGLSLVRVLLGDYTIAFVDFFRILGGEEIPGPGPARFIVMSDRLPKVVLGVLAGAAFALSGTIFQLLLRNPLASPDVVGVSAGASLFVVIGLASFSLSGIHQVGAALAGGFSSAILVWLLSRGRRRSRHGVGSPHSVGAQASSSVKFVLVGIGVSAVATSLVTYMMLRMHIGQTSDAVLWTRGSLSMATWDRVQYMAVLLVICVVLLSLLARNLHMLSSGDELAHGLGVNVPATRRALLCLAVILVAGATALTGPIMFVGFMAGPLVRLVLRGRDSLICSALVGALLVITAEVVGSMLMPRTVPVGVITGIVGVPVLLSIILTRTIRKT
ncbi:iron ABC transporter permease [Auritidibacter ignavus]|uniref:FecCD family ABC transporter permease n=1 Tax=Auritidibacter ignavus TaxID=678932 RepID=UPI002FE5E102